MYILLNKQLLFMSVLNPASVYSVLEEFIAAAVHSHFDDCPDSHSHFCFHGTCRFLILEETPACVCHPGFVGMRCEHADLLAVVASNHRQQTVATMLVLCVVGSVLLMLLCTLLNGLTCVFWSSRRCSLKNVTTKSSILLLDFTMTAFLRLAQLVSAACIESISMWAVGELNQTWNFTFRQTVSFQKGYFWNNNSKWQELKIELKN
uniref:Transforming growth factor alpha n=1 Tax=Cyprinus carpio TaxID=7962 RepID=A0A8C2BF59_CYPCA